MILLIVTGTASCWGATSWAGELIAEEYVSPDVLDQDVLDQDVLDRDFVARELVLRGREFGPRGPRVWDPDRDLAEMEGVAGMDEMEGIEAEQRELDLEMGAEVNPDANSAVCDQGFVFIGGKYLPPPYRIEFRDRELFINDQRISYPVPERPLAPGWHADFQRIRHRPHVTPVQLVAYQLREGAAIVEVPNHISVSLNEPRALHAFLDHLVADSKPAELPADLANYLVPDQRRAWAEWMPGFAPTADLKNRIHDYQLAVNSIENSNASSISAVRRLDRFAYPLTVIGMVFVVLAVGHLLLHRPDDSSSEPVNTSPRTLQLVSRSVMLVLALSALDLAWTILASQAGQMRELNPLGSRLIQDPMALAMFKVSMTGMSAGLIFSLRKYRQAQVAAWWACLICTLLTVRWLVFNSMFVA